MKKITVLFILLFLGFSLNLLAQKKIKKVSNKKIFASIITMQTEEYCISYNDTSDLLAMALSEHFNFVFFETEEMEYIDTGRKIILTAVFSGERNNFLRYNHTWNGVTTQGKPVSFMRGKVGWYVLLPNTEIKSCEDFYKLREDLSSRMQIISAEE